MKTYVRRLKEHIGDLPVRQITKAHLVEFKRDLWRFPKRLKKRHTGMTFTEILIDIGDDPNVPRLKPKTVKKWLDTLSIVFNHGVSHGRIEQNPTTGLKPKLPKKKTEPAKLSYDEADIAAIFSSPMFTGCHRVHNGKGKVYGYREKHGTFLTKDTRYWLPLLAAWMGFRLEEAGGTPLADVKRDHGIDYLDLQERDLKTEGSKRLVPIHPKLIALGFLDYVAKLRAAGETYLFPDLPNDDKAATRRFTKWRGLWTCANSKAQSIDGKGFDDPRKSFHSFRHSFKHACRGLMTKEIHDLLTGHGDGSVSSDYGPGRSWCGSLRPLRRWITRRFRSSLNLTPISR
jgi:integrase